MTEPDPQNRYSGHGLLDNPRSSHRRVMALGIGLSAALHVIVIVLYSFGLREWGPRESLLGVESASRPFSGMRVVQVVEISEPEDPADAPRPEPRVEPEPVVDAQGPEPAAGPAEEEPAEGGEARGVVRAADVLRVRSSDARLWRAALPEVFQLTEAERLQLELAGLLEAWNDSVAAALSAETAFTDWTRTDDQGNRWGVSPGKLHLGSLTLPLPFNFGGTTWQRQRTARRAWEDADILNSLNAQEFRAHWEDRARAIRERKDRQRREAGQQPDTTRRPGGRQPL